MATYRPEIDQSQHVKSVSHIIILVILNCKSIEMGGMLPKHFYLFIIIINNIQEADINNLFVIPISDGTTQMPPFEVMYQRL